MTTNLKRSRQTLISVLSVLCALPPATARTEPPTPALTFTLETKQKVVQFLESLAIPVVLRNNSHSAVSLNTKNLRLIPDAFHVVGTWGQWSPAEGEPLETENGSSGQVQLRPGSSLRLCITNEFPLFELLGPTRVSYRLTSSDPGTRKLLPADPSELAFDIPPTKLISAVWSAQTQLEREQAQPAFNEVLKFTRITTPANGRINSFDWLDDRTLIFDRLEQGDGIVPHSSLRRIWLTNAASKN